MELPLRTVSRLVQIVKGIPRPMAEAWAATLYGCRSWQAMLESMKSASTFREDWELGTDATLARIRLQAEQLADLGRYELADATFLALELRATCTKELTVCDEGHELIAVHGAGMAQKYALASLLEALPGAPGEVLARMMGMGSDAPEPTKGADSFFAAIKARDAALVEKLLVESDLALEDGAANLANAISLDKMPALVFATTYGDLDIVKLLLAHGAYVDAQDSEGFTALSEAATKGDFEIVHWLITMFDADVNLYTNSGWTPLMLSASRNHGEDAVRLANFEKVQHLLIDEGASLDFSHPAGSPRYLLLKNPKTASAILQQIK